MLDFLSDTIRQFFALMPALYPAARVTGYAIAFALVIGCFVAQKRGLERYRGPTFRVDLAYMIWFPILTFIVSAPLSLTMANLVTNYAPFVRLNLLGGLPAWLNVVIWFTAADFLQYLMHRTLHSVRWLWVLHRIHHSQTALPPLTSWRVHWLEIVYLNLGAFAISLPLGDFTGYHAVAIGALAALQIANHSDLDWGYGLFSLVIVSPRFHSRHHSAAPEDRNVNFGASLAIWDRLFGTARDGQLDGIIHGLGSSDVPPTFLGQLIYPLSTWPRRLATSIHPQARRANDPDILR